MNQPTKETELHTPTTPITRDKPRSIGLTALLFAVTTLGAAVLVGAMRVPKLPPAAGD